MPYFKPRGLSNNYDLLYSNPFPSTRKGPLYNAFSYPTKISPEAIAVFIATHTEPGAVVLDTFGGSGTTGLAALLCDKPTTDMLELATKMGLEPKWGPRTAHIYEIGVLGSFVAKTLCSAPSPDRFAAAVKKLSARAEELIGWIYKTKDLEGKTGILRHVIWSDVLGCPKCDSETSYWKAVVKRAPLSLSNVFICPKCEHTCKVDSCTRILETVEDEFSGEIERKKRIPVKVYGKTGTTKWSRDPTADDFALIDKISGLSLPPLAPNKSIIWGDLYRAGYHKGIEKLHHFYTKRNFYAVSTLWGLVDEFQEDLRDPLYMLILSYNATHSTLMSRVVVKKGQRDLVLTGAQSGVLYVSGLPVEKNVIEGITRKSKSFIDSFNLVNGSKSEVVVHQASSEKLSLPSGSVDYVFTDPPFGGYIPYAEINQINELWLGTTTTRENEIIISKTQGKGIQEYGKMMSCVFDEISRVLKPDGLATIVFHSAHSDVWRALVSAYVGAGLLVKDASILDKIQASFKQVVSKVSVKGDALILLSKNECPNNSMIEFIGVAAQIIQDAKNRSPKEQNPQLLYSHFVGRCLTLGIDVGMDAKDFYSRVREAFGNPT